MLSRLGHFDTAHKFFVPHLTYLRFKYVQPEVIPKQVIFADVTPLYRKVDSLNVTNY